MNSTVGWVGGLLVSINGPNVTAQTGNRHNSDTCELDQLENSTLELRSAKHSNELNR